MANLEKIVDELSNLSVLDIVQLSKMLEEKWGVSAAAPVAAVAAAGSAAPAVEEKTSFDVVFVSVSAEKKIEVIKKIREINSSLSLVEAKQAAENGNFTLATGVDKAKAQELQKALEAAGAKVELK